MPDAPFIAIGDIHGEKEALDALMDALPQDIPLVILGDMIDRGPNSKDVLAHFMHTSIQTGSTTCLLGNHERMMLDFLDDPQKNGGKWLLNGGEITLASFGLNASARRGVDHPLVNLANALRRIMPHGMEAWLRSLPLYWSSGNIVCVHAALDPKCAVEECSERILLWGNAAKIQKTPRTDGIIVVHGHIPVPKPVYINGRIAIDTGAGKGGKLSAAIICSTQDPVFLQAN